MSPHFHSLPLPIYFTHCSQSNWPKGQLTLLVRNLQWLPIFNQKEQQTLRLKFKSLCNLAPIYFIFSSYFILLLLIAKLVLFSFPELALHFITFKLSSCSLCWVWPPFLPMNLQSPLTSLHRELQVTLCGCFKSWMDGILWLSNSLLNILAREFPNFLHFL